MRSILLTGSRGILGYRIKEKIAESYPNLHLHELQSDLTDSLSLTTEVAGLPKIDQIIHLAAIVPVQAVKENVVRAYEVNVTGTINLLSAFQHKGKLPYIFYCSSSHVYRPQSGKISENSILEPSSIYGRTKLMAELVIKDAYREDVDQYLIGRVFSLYDDRQSGEYLYPSIKRRLAKHDYSKPFVIHGGNSIRDFQTARQIAIQILKLVDLKASGIVNIGSGIATTITDFVRNISSDNLIFETVGAQTSLVANISKLKQLLLIEDSNEL